MFLVKKHVFVHICACFWTLFTPLEVLIDRLELFPPCVPRFLLPTLEVCVHCRQGWGGWSDLRLRLAVAGGPFRVEMEALGR